MSKPVSISHGRRVSSGDAPGPGHTDRLRLSEHFPALRVPRIVRSRAPEWLIVVGCSVFIFVLLLSAVWDPSIRWLHFFQAWMYIAALWLSLRKNRWGYFIGFSAAGLWAYSNLFVSTFFVNGLQQLALWVHTGHLNRPDLLIAIPAWLANGLVVIGSTWAYSQLSRKKIIDLSKFLLSFALTTGFFALDMALFQPRYLPLFRHLLHPHLP